MTGSPRARRLASPRSTSTLDQSALRELASRTFSAEPRSFLKWAGSKQRVLTTLVPYLPREYKRYFEPFLGSGALFFLLNPRYAVLGDSCDDLMTTYAAVRDDVTSVLRFLAPLNPLDKERYYQIRANRSNAYYKRAAEFIYLNRACWNGLYRVNARGEFNVPYGAPKTASTVEASNLKACAELLNRRSVHLYAGDFEPLVDECGRGDLVFFDPPYVTGHNNNGFIDYNEDLFSWSDQERLAKVARKLAKRGAHVIVTNALHDTVTKLYNGFKVTTLSRFSTLAGASDSRRQVTEALIVSHSAP